MLKRISKYNIKKLVPMAMLALTPLANSCDKGEDIDPLQKSIDQKKIEIVEAEKNVRKAVVPAKTITIDVSSYFNMLFERYENEIMGHKAQNIQDSVYTLQYVVKQARKEAGDPLPNNNETMSDLYDKTCIAIQKYAELDALESQR